MVPPALAALIREHRDSHHIFYPPLGNADRVQLRPPAIEPGAGFVSISRTGLEVFHATHEFFALHLVTGSHAFRVCSPWLGPNRSGCSASRSPRLTW